MRHVRSLEADRVLAGEPGVRDLLDESNITTQFKAVPTEGTDVELLRQLSTAFEELPSVFEVKFAEDQISLISQLQSFFGFRLLLLSGFLLFAAVLLIWNTIRTAIFARRREIEVMKLVGATDWFIRIPFMLEGLLHGIIGGALASVGLWAWNSQWTSGVQDFPQNSGFAALVVVDGYDKTVMLIMIAIGALAGAIGSGIAASRFLDICSRAGCGDGCVAELGRCPKATSLAGALPSHIRSRLS